MITLLVGARNEVKVNDNLFGSGGHYKNLKMNLLKHNFFKKYKIVMHVRN